MVPGHPRALIACRYHGLNQPEPRGTLAATASLPASTVASAFNAAVPLTPGEPLPACPNDSSEEALLIFRYANNSRLLVTVDMSGCGWTTNGDRTAWTPPALRMRLQAGLGHDTY